MKQRKTHYEFFPQHEPVLLLTAFVVEESLGLMI